MSEVCQACHQPYDTVYRVPDVVWKKISPKTIDGHGGGGLLCPPCADARASKAGYFLFWSAEVGRYPVAEAKEGE